MRRLRLFDIFQAGRFTAAVGEQRRLIHIFIVNRHHAAMVINREEAHTVVVVTELLFLIFGAVVALRIKRGCAIHQRITPGDQHVGAIARGYHNLIGRGRGNRLKAQQWAARRLLLRQCTARERQAAAEKAGQADSTGTGKEFTTQWIRQAVSA